MKMFRQSACSLLVGVLAAGLLASCATKREVQQIVTDSNAAILSQQLGADSDLVIAAEKKGKSNALDAASGRIDAFIAAHPDQMETAAALRVRQGMLLLSAKEPELAQAAFAQAAVTNLHTPRDQTLKAISEHLLWWFEASEAPFKRDPQNSKKDDYAQATNALARLLDQQRSLSERAVKDPAVEGIRDYVAETRAWIGLRYTSALPNAQAEEARAAFVNTVTNYVVSLGANAIARIPCGCKCKEEKLPQVITLDLRRCFRAREVLKYAFELLSVKFAQNPPQLPESSASLVQDWK
jgi:hypothetical protein